VGPIPDLEEAAVTEETRTDLDPPTHHRLLLGAVLAGVAGLAWASGAVVGAALSAGGLVPWLRQVGTRADTLRRRWAPGGAGPGAHTWPPRRPTSANAG
jgi:hypothetical protein